MQTIYIRNSRRGAPTGSITLTKVDGYRPHCGLPGAVFKLFRWDVQAGRYRTHCTNLTTDSAGRLKVCGLPPGRYKWIELRAPQGYALDLRAQYIVEIPPGCGEGTVVSLTVRNWPCCPPCRPCPPQPCTGCCSDGCECAQKSCDP